MAGSQISTSVTIINSLLGFQAMSLTNFDTSAESVIAAGSKVEIASAFFTFSSDDTPQATTWTAITTANTAYITLTPSGTAGSQIVTSKYSDTAPTWSDSKQGWYTSAASVVRYIGGVIKGSATQYDDAFVMDNTQFAAGNARITREIMLDDGNEIDVSASFTDGMSSQTVILSGIPKDTVAVFAILAFQDAGSDLGFQWQRASGDSGFYRVYAAYGSTATRQLQGTYWIPTNGDSLFVVSWTSSVALSPRFVIYGYKVSSH